jgi:neutral ceramidase
MKVGAASVDITPSLGLAMDGYEARVGGATGVHDPLSAFALVAEGDDGTAVALVVADLLQIDPGLQRVVAYDVLRTTGIPRERLQLAGTHTHSGPLVPPDSAVERVIGDRIAKAVERAWQQRRPAAVAVGVGHVDGIGANRRPNGGPLDDRVTVVRFDEDGAAGAPIATLVNYGCHPTTLGPDNNLYSADYPGVLRRELAQRIGGVTMFTTGPQGDVNPGGYSPEGSMVGVVVPWRTFESAERYGASLAAVADEVYRGLVPVPADAVWGMSSVLELARKSLPEPVAARRAADAAIDVATAIREADLSADATYHAAVAAAYADLAAHQAAAHPPSRPVPVRVSALGIGSFTHVGVQGELFVALGQRIRAELGADRTCIAALCDGTVGYIPTTGAYAEGGYEPNASVLRAGEGERLVEDLVALVRDEAARAGASTSATGTIR